MISVSAKKTKGQHAVVSSVSMASPGKKKKKATYCRPEGFPVGSEVKKPPANAEDVGSISGLGGSPGEGNGNLLQYSCLGNPMDNGAWWATVRGVTKELDMS